MRVRLKNSIALSGIVQIILVKWLGSHPEWVEQYYSEGIYLIISKFLRLLFGWIPFSVGDLLYTALGILALRYIFRNRVLIKKKPFSFFRDVAMLLSLIYFIFHLCWGMNYYRVPITEKLQIGSVYTTTELASFSNYLVAKTNHYQEQVAPDTLTPVKITAAKAAIFKSTIEGYQQLERSYPFLTYQQPSLKQSLYSLPLTYMGYGGYINPFTNEAQVNGKIPAIRLPTISGHEVGHQVGYSAEDATNFIGFLVTSKNKDPHFKYAAYSHALAYCLSDLSLRDKGRFDELYAKLNPGVKKNYKELRDFWKRYKNPTEPLFKAVFNAFLKANNQEKGIESYNAVVGLLINYHKVHGF
ncbi:MAG: DUF3810 domain-containing protein [Bacteroidota bacterium]